VRFSAPAPAKVNLFLHVGPKEVDGYHPLCSLMVFADIGDDLTLLDADHPGFEVDGPFAAALRGQSNLVEEAVRRLLAHTKGPTAPFTLRLTKRLPVASGLGGGSSDAGAALKLVRDALDLKISDEALAGIAGELGSDGPACLYARPVLASGRGERLNPPPELPVLDAVLVNPGAACSTAAVYRAYDAGPTAAADEPPLPDRFEDSREVAAVLSLCRNDLEAPAIQVAPEIADVLGLLRSEPETLLARLSGSGATAFALCPGDIEAEGLAEKICRLRPAWWVRRCRLGGPWIPQD
jgi:4-diphosphocytidyl-2-C-methyl-D-erythritol kinase